jgi:hypothetical protein
MMVRSFYLSCLFCGTLCFVIGDAVADHEHYDGPAHHGKLKPNTKHPMGNDHHAHTDGNGKVTHMSRNGQKHAKVFGAKQQKHKDGRKVFAGLEVAPAERLSGQESTPE